MEGATGAFVPRSFRGPTPVRRRRREQARCPRPPPPSGTGRSGRAGGRLRPSLSGLPEPESPLPAFLTSPSPVLRPLRRCSATPPRACATARRAPERGVRVPSLTVLFFVLHQLEDDVWHLRHEELLHREANRVRRARQTGKELRAGGDRDRARQGTTQHGGGSYLLIGEHAEDLAEPVKLFVDQATRDLVGAVPAGDASPAGCDDGVHAVVGEKLREDFFYPLRVVPDDLAPRHLVPGPLHRLHDGVPAGVGLVSAGVAYREDGDPDTIRRRLPVLSRALAHGSPPPLRNGLVTRSRPIVVSGPCPERTRVSSGKVKSLSEMLLMRTSMLPPGRSTLPTLPAKSASPEKTRPSSSTKNARCPGAWPGVYMERSRKDPTSRTSSSPTCRSTLGILPNLMPIIIACWGTAFSIASASACMRTGHIYSSMSWATAPTWSMWEWVTIICPISSPTLSTVSAMRAASSPGSMIAPVPESSSPIT